MKITIKKQISDENIQKLDSKFIDKIDDFRIFDENVDIYKEDGELLLKFRKNVFSKNETKLLFDNLRNCATLNASRPSASGAVKGKRYKYIVSKSSGKLLHVLTKKSRSGILGYYDRSSNFSRTSNKKKSKGKCRMTYYTEKHLHKFNKCLPIFKKVNDLYKKIALKYYNKQKEAIKTLNRKYIIKDTVFTTITVNKNFRTAMHKDSGDYEKGIGNLLVCSNGDYQGGYTLFPQYKIGVDCRDGDFLLMNVHEYHCNSKLTIKKDIERISFVFFLREKMLNLCPLTPSRAKNPPVKKRAPSSK